MKIEKRFWKREMLFKIVLILYLAPNESHFRIQIFKSKKLGAKFSPLIPYDSIEYAKLNQREKKQAEKELIEKFSLQSEIESAKSELLSNIKKIIQ